MSGLSAAGHQPHYLPWLGYVDKIAQVDVFYLVDCIAFDEKLYQHRNRILAADGEKWLVVPVLSDPAAPPLLSDLRIDNSTPWAREHWTAIRDAYEKAPHFREYAPFFEDLYARPWERLADLDAHMIQGVIDFLGLETRLERASALGVREEPGKNLHVDACRKLGATTYMSGAGGGCSHLDEEQLREAGITHVKQQFKHPTYPQGREPFVPSLAVIDLLFQCGPRSAEILAGKAS